MNTFNLKVLHKTFAFNIQFGVNGLSWRKTSFTVRVVSHRSAATWPQTRHTRGYRAGHPHLPTNFHQIRRPRCTLWKRATSTACRTCGAPSEKAPEPTDPIEVHGKGQVNRSKPPVYLICSQTAADQRKTSPRNFIEKCSFLLWIYLSLLSKTKIWLEPTNHLKIESTFFKWKCSLMKFYWCMASF